ncbi:MULTISPECIES: SDR family oxidoreductase [Nocardiopsis]|uniref:Short-chain dehydrogenase/reductase SDR n=1 Tax=Nocardiopsis dassonvillei (strain ATCC 23218 / DSM 43111 / CIP 107115 / JCM 7437 / KCTC 9190 / NBRC 14626 / NCTC 10488 / NRRL B-5397 / IMRU 509) TaxID=446468 RepID=D7AY75_NOCDD|nr:MULTISPECIES: SDR family oxidoreductase [Nocardiopsis]ADH69953.1 short-chain dehydrogenase/reductase SDR [Nocardiopsis dassonvillei subsp. dassonvillei DSM 43111]APC37947.1 short-chain dehydrogenase [Nocardiopsis dassonvillei]ASU60857.1 short-chain dehydrogenase [Nocardiopsis dassonvillei]NKY77501.1 SDR family oxidoreductase [Nocardiopsis dassonvillei]VEI90466.1 3-oxoacyl-[acyl-carrier-protein] reductase FabG [Nocardiopsis dassonvillei]
MSTRVGVAEVAGRPNGRIAVVSGASAGVGRATAREFARRGYTVALLARGQAGLEAAAEEARAEGVAALPLRVDVSDAEAVRGALAQVESELGPVDVWVNCVLATVISPFMEVEPEEYRRVTDVCYHGYVYGTQAALERMLPRDRGVIVQVGSALAYRGIPLQAAYCGAKHAIRGFTDSVRAELIHRGSGVRVTEVHLPAVNTPQFTWTRAHLDGRRPRPVAPVYQPEVAARAIVWGAEHPRRRRYWVGVSTVATVLGQRFAPRVLDWQLGLTGRKSQVRDAHPPARDNLFRPLDGEHDFGAHGEFDDESRESSLLQELSQRRSTVALLGAAGFAVGAAGYAVARGAHRRP